MEKQDLKEIQRKIGYQFNNIALLFQTFTRKSYSNQFGGENNEVLEFLGDEILDFYVTKIIADNFGLMKSQSDYYNKNKQKEHDVLLLYDVDDGYKNFRFIVSRPMKRKLHCHLMRHGETMIPRESWTF